MIYTEHKSADDDTASSNYDSYDAGTSHLSARPLPPLDLRLDAHTTLTVQPFEMVDSTADYQLQRYDWLAQQLDTCGYLLLRGVLDPQQVHKARAVVLQSLQREFACIARSNQAYGATATPSATSKLLTGYEPLTHHPAVLPVVHNRTIAHILGSVLRHASHNTTPISMSTFSTKWLRCIAPGDATDIHCDYYRFADAHVQSNLYTVWQPLAYSRYTPYREGTLIVCSGSHKLITQHTGTSKHPQDEHKYGEHDNDYKEIESELPSGFRTFHQQPSTQWHTTSFDAGDLVIFDIRLMHASTTNQSLEYRISMDSRWTATDGCRGNASFEAVV